MNRRRGTVWLTLAAAVLAETCWAQPPQPPLEKWPARPPVERWEQPEPGAAARRDQPRLLMLLAPRRPVFVRLRAAVTVQSKQASRETALQAAWQDSMEEAFGYLDQDDDGQLTIAELSRADWNLERVPQPVRRSPFASVVAQFLTAGKASPEAPDAQRAIGREEFRRRYVQSSPPLELTASRIATPNTERLFRLLDRSQDGALDQGERAEVAAQLSRLDFNDDQVVGRFEPMQLDNPFSLQSMRQSGTYQGDLLLVTEDQISQLAVRLFNTYSSENQVRLEALGDWSGHVEKFDANGDGALSDLEWMEVLADPPLDAEIIARVAPVNNGYPQSQPGGAPSAGGAGRFEAVAHISPVVVSDFDVRICAGGADLHLIIATNQFDPLSNLEPQFKNADSDNNGYIDNDERNRDYFISQVFGTADTDGNGMLYLEEVRQYVARQRSRNGSRVEGTVRNVGRRVFSALDRNGDQRIDLAEQERAADTLAELDSNGNGHVEQSELPVSYEVELARAQPSVLRNIYYRGLDANVRPPQPQGPMWFQRLDRNRDAVVSRDEYPGPEAQFKKLDADNDGNISLSESQP